MSTHATRDERVVHDFVSALAGTLEDERENGDYSVFPAITEEEARRAVERAGRFVAELARFLAEQGFETGQ